MYYFYCMLWCIIYTILFPLQFILYTVNHILSSMYVYIGIVGQVTPNDVNNQHCERPLFFCYLDVLVADAADAADGAGVVVMLLVIGESSGSPAHKGVLGKVKHHDKTLAL